MLVLGIASLLVPLASGQEPGTDSVDGEEVVSDALEIAPVDVPNYAEGYRWIPATPLAGDDLVWASMAVDPYDATRVLSLDLEGGTWLSTDGGRTWGRVVQPLGLAEAPEEADDEDILLEAESIADDFLDEVDEVEADFDGSDALDEAEDSLQEVQERLGAGEVDQLLQVESRAGVRVGGVVWFHPDHVGVAVMVRGDGCWRSNTGGRTWTRSSDFSTATDLESGPDGLVVAGSDNGVRYTLDGARTWIRTSGPLEGQRVRDVEFDGAQWWAATNTGLYTATDAQSWWKVGEWEADLRSLLIENDGAWIATDNELLRMDSEGRIHSPSRHPLPGTVRILRLDVGQMLVAGRDGVWQSRDDGVTWRAVSFGLDDPRVHELAMGPDGPLLVGYTGIWRLLPGDLVEKAGAVEEKAPPALDTVLDVALTRPGMTIAPAELVRRSALAARLLPRADVKARYYDYDVFAGDYGDRTNDGEDDRTWTIEFRLTWNGETLVTDLDNDFAYDTFDSGTGLYVVEGEVFGDSPAGLPVAAANVASRGISYRTLVASTVIELYESRGALVRQRAVLPKGDLPARAQHELKIMEVTAMLDGYTDGAFSAALTDDGDE